MKNILDRFSSRKFLFALLGFSVALGVGLQDGFLTSQEVWTALAPLLTFMGFEGAADVVTRNAEK